MAAAARIAEKLPRLVADEADEVFLFALDDGFVAHHLVAEQIAECLAKALFLEHRLILALGPGLGFDAAADGGRFVLRPQDEGMGRVERGRRGGLAQ